MRQSDHDIVRALLAASPDCIEVLAADGTIRFINATGAKAAGFDRGEESVGLDFADLFSGDEDERQAMRAGIAAAATGQASIVRSSRATADGPRLFETSLAPMGGPVGAAEVLGISRDITRRAAVADHAAAEVAALKATAETLAFDNAQLALDNAQLEQDIFRQLHEVNSSRSRLQAYFDACPDYICLVRLSHDTGLLYEDINPAAETLYGLDRGRIVGRAPHEVDDAATAAEIAANVAKCLASGRPVTFQGERTFGGKAAAFVQVVGAPLGYFNEEEGLVLFCGRDMTEQRAVEDALRQSQKMEAVGQLTGGLAHDFNNLLTGIQGSLDLLQLRLAQGRFDMAERYVSAAQGAASRAAALTHRLLAFSRRQTLDPKPTDVNRLAADMEDLLVRTVGPEITLTLSAAAGLWTIIVDPSQLENALLNLCLNARDAMPDGGRITIETRNVRLDSRLADERALPAGDYVSLSVTDDGIGMPPDVVKRIFDPFFTTKPIGSGTGLGLSMIHGFAHQSGGQVRVHSRVGAGTTMRILLPRHFGEAAIDAAGADLSDAPRAVHGQTVLVVDDDATVRMLVAEVLRDLGYAVIEAADGTAGIAILASDERIDLLVTDVGLPGGVNGRQVAEAGRARRAALKVLFVTGYAENAVLNHGHLDAGMQVLTKPFAMEALASRIKRLLGDA